MGGLSIWHWLIVLVVVIVIFGTKRLRNVGQDLGEAVKGFKKGMQDDADDDGKTDDGRPAARLGNESRRADAAAGARIDPAQDNAAARQDDRDPPAAG